MTTPSMRIPTRLVVAGLALTAAVALAQPTAEEPPTRGHHARPAGAHPAPPNPQAAEDRALLRQLADAQRALGEQMQQLRDRVDELHDDLASRKDEEDASDDEMKALRDEVKGLYVESSGVKQQIDALKDDIGSVNANVSGFRTYSGFFIALMILMLAMIFFLTVRR
jgi:predicted RNase H-like nuclease (RuvC/YqgF family)